jgi:outer membrane protein assembly factor BamD (BamD/ComL family)
MSVTADNPDLRCFRGGQRCLRWGLLLMAVAGVTALAGCQSTWDVSALKGDFPPRTRDEAAGASEPRASIDGVMGPTERQLKQAAWEQEKRAASGGQAIAGLAEYEGAERLFQARRYAEAEKAFKTLAESRRTQGMSWAERFADSLRGNWTGDTESGPGQFGDPVEEDALFMIAEAQFHQQKYSWAQDSYDALLSKYPSTRHLDVVTRRLFTIARAWLGFPEADDSGNVELASRTLSDTNPRTGNRAYERPSFFNVADRSRPLFDTSGRALQALRSIWLNDANGPLADDALMLTANHHLQSGDFIEAARVYQLLREQYPDSPHFEDAYLLDSHVRLAAYEGPGYDDKSLEEARRLKETAQRLFPQMDEQQKQRLQRELERIANAEIEREWHNVEFYSRKGDDAAVALHCNLLLNRFPGTPYAARAQQTLEGLAEKYRPRRGPSFDVLDWEPSDLQSPALAGVIRPGRTIVSEGPARVASPTEAASGSMPAAPGPEESSAPAQSPASTEAPGIFRRLLRRVDQDPQLRPVVPPPTDPNMPQAE